MENASRAFDCDPTASVFYASDRDPMMNVQSMTDKKGKQVNFMTNYPLMLQLTRGVKGLGRARRTTLTM